MAEQLREFLEFIDRSPSPHHAVAQVRTLFRAAGFTELDEADAWRLDPGAGYFVVRGGKTIIAWRQGARPVAEHGFRIIAAHTDSPVLKLRPRPETSVGELGLLATEIYGSPLLHTWLDRDLKLAGAFFYESTSGALKTRPFELPELKVRAVSLAPHLKTEKRIEAVSIDMHKDLPVIVSEAPGGVGASIEEALARFAPDMRRLLDIDVSLADCQPCALIGASEEFVSGPRLDNLQSTYCAAKALIAAPASAPHASVAALYDAEEIGSRVWTGAQSNVLDAVLARIALADDAGSDGLLRAKARSALVSADMAHAEHPSFRDATDPAHAPELNKGVALKSGARGNYAIGHRISAWFAMICAEADVPTQRFMYRCDHGAGSSVGPLITTGVGIEGVDVGAPMLAMHSIREIAGAKDLAHTLAAYANAFASSLAPTAEIGEAN